jgi:glycosyltransferase involved in cell wall biosynthesis
MPNKPIRILQVQSSMDRGGAETLVMSLYRKINREHVQFDFVVNTEKIGAYEEEIQQLGGRVIRCPAFKGYNLIGYVRWWKEFLAHSEYLVIHSHIFGTASIFLSVARAQGLHTICHSHSTSNGKGLYSAIKYLFQLPVRYVSDSMIACSDDAGKWLFGKNVVHNPRYEVWKNGIDVQAFRFDKKRRDRVRAQLGVTDQVALGHVGRFIPVKNHKFLIKVFKAYYDIQPRSVLLLVGDGPLVGEAKELANDLGIGDYIHFLGVRKDIPDLLDAMDFFLLPSLYEGFPISAVEAQTSGLRCLISDRVPHDIQISDDLTFIPIDNGVQPWCDALLASNITSDREHAYKRVVDQGYDITEMASYVERFYEDLYTAHITSTQTVHDHDEK